MTVASAPSMTVASAPSTLDETVYLALGAFAGGVCVWEFSSTEGVTSCFSDADAHTGPVRATRFTSAGQLLTGGDDGVVQVLNVRKKSRVAVLEAHEDQVNALSVVEEASGFVHVLSGAGDASIGVWGRVAGRWECKRRMRRHRGAVLALAAHPSARLALSLGADGTLRTWNLLRGRQAFVVRLKSRPERAVDVLWSPDGSRYLVQFPHRFDCFRVDDAQTPSCSVAAPDGVSAVAFLTSTTLVFASGLRLSFRDLARNGDETSALAVTDEGDRRSKIRSLVWDEHQRLLFVLTRHSQGGGLVVFHLPAEAANALMLCATDIPFRVTSFDARRFTRRPGSSAGGEEDEVGSETKRAPKKTKKKAESGSKEAKAGDKNKAAKTKKRKREDSSSPKSKKKRLN